MDVETRAFESRVELASWERHPYLSPNITDRWSFT